jgi:hypothetical protein
LTTILADSGSQAAPDSLLYSVEPQPSTVHDLLLQKADGTFELAVWGEQLSGTNQVTVRLGTKVETAEVYDPTLGTSPVERHSRTDAVALTLSNHPLILALPRGKAGSR